MDNNKIYVPITLTLEDVDVVLNALEEKALNIQALRQSIYDTANAQIEIRKIQEQEQQKLDEEKENKNKRGKRK